MDVMFYTIENSSEINEVGHYPQTTSFLSDYKKDAPNSVYNIRWNEIPSFEPNLEGIQVHDKSKLTDVVSFFIGGDYPLLSDKVVSILENFRLPKHKIEKATLLGKEKKLPYNILLCKSDAINNLILEESLFSIQNRVTLQEEKTFKVSTLGELKNIAVDCVMNGKKLVKKKLVFTEHVLDYDLFNLDFIGGLHISIVLANELIKQSISGIELNTVSYEVK
jgi:hypothetical protein